MLFQREDISNAAVVFQVENVTHPSHPLNREEISLTCLFRTCQRRKHSVCVCVCEHPDGPKLVAWGQTPQVEMAAITEYRAATGGLVTKNTQGAITAEVS